MKKTIALCMIVKNEESHLERCLASAKSVVDEIIIVDTGSTDRTIEIAENYGAKVYHFDWINDFSAARNESIKHADSDYILTLDADEYLAENSDLQTDLASNHDYYFVKVHNILSGNRAINHLAIRLFINNKGLEYRNRLHEHLNTMDESKNLTSAHSQITIMHVGYTDEMMESRSKAKRNLPLMLEEVNEHPTPYNLFNMGRTYMWIGEHEKAIHYLKRAYPLSKELIIAPELIATLCKSLSELGKDEEALLILRDAVKVYPYEVDILHLQALTFEKISYKKDAIRSMEACLKIGDQGITVSEGNGTYIAHFKLSEWYEDLDRIEQSYMHIEQTLQIKNDFAVGLHRYVQMLDKVGIPEEDAYLGMKQLYPISEVEHLKNVIEVLYALRSPLLLRFLQDSQIKVEEYVQATALQYAKQYTAAIEIWMNIEGSSKVDGQDLMVLAILEQNIDLAKTALSRLNLSKNEKKFILSIFGSENKKEFKFTLSLEKLFEFIMVQLLKLKEFEYFEKVLKNVWGNSNELKYIMCQYLIKYGFAETAIDLLAEEYKQSRSNNFRIIEQLARACKKQGYYEDAKSLYETMIEKQSKYQDYEGLYDLYEKAGETASANLIKEYMKSTYPLCEWVRN